MAFGFPLGSKLGPAPVEAAAETGFVANALGRAADELAANGVGSTAACAVGEVAGVEAELPSVGTVVGGVLMPGAEAPDPSPSGEDAVAEGSP